MFESRKYRLRGTSPILGSQPASEAVRTRYIASRAPSRAAVDEEKRLYPLRDDDYALTVFARDFDHGDRLVVLDYMLRGFFKSALGALVAQLNVRYPKSKVDKYLFVCPRRVPVLRNGHPIYEEDSQYERPLRVDSAYGPCTVLQGSECIDCPWELEIELRLIPNPASSKSKPLSWAAVEEALNYGALCGLGKFRNGGFGTFVWERIES